MNDTLLGQVFALADYREQALFLNTAGKTLRRTCESAAYVEIQLCRIADELDDHGASWSRSWPRFWRKPHDLRTVQEAGRGAA